MRGFQTSASIIFLNLIFAASGAAGQFSFAGSFTNDNDVQFFTFSLFSPNTVTLQTWGYGGGTNAAGQSIAPGGFESILQVYDALNARLRDRRFILVQIQPVRRATPTRICCLSRRVSTPMHNWPCLPATICWHSLKTPTRRWAT